MQRAEVSVVTAALAGQLSVYRVVNIVAPLGIETKAANFSRVDEPGIVQVALGNEHQLSAECRFERLDFNG